MKVTRTKNWFMAVLTLTVLLVAVAACAPAAGSQGSTAIRAGRTPVPASGGQTIYVRVDYSLDDFRLNEGDLVPALWVPSGHSSARGDVSPSFALHDVQGASGWDISLSQMKIERITQRAVSFGTESTFYELWAEVRVIIPADPIPGVYRVRGTIQARGGVSRPMQFSVEIR